MKTHSVFVVGLLLSGLVGMSQSLGVAASHTTRTDSGGGVTVKATLLDSKTSGEVRFQVVLDTHSVNLDGYDLKSLSVLRDEAGNTYPPTAVENKGSGHHRQSTVVFSKVAPSTKRVELVIKNVAGVKERLFRWELE